MLKRRSVFAVLFCCIGAAMAGQTGQQANQTSEPETRCRRGGGAHGASGKRQQPKVFSRRQVGELYFQHERLATGMDCAF